MNACIGTNNSVSAPNNFGKEGNRRIKKAGIGTPPPTGLPPRRNCTIRDNKCLKAASSRWYRFPQRIAHKLLIIDTVKISLKSTTWSGSDWAADFMSDNKSLISSIIWSSIDVFPKPRSRKWRSVNLLCSCQSAPSVNIKPWKQWKDIFNNFKIHFIHG